MLALASVGGSPARADDPPDPDPAAALARANALADQVATLHAKGQYAEAMPLAREALVLRERALGPDHLDVAASLGWLGALHFGQGAYAEAAAAYERAVAIREKALGGDDPRVAEVLVNLSSALRARGAYAEARVAIDRALAILKKAHGEEHPEVARGLTMLGIILRAQGNFAEARPVLERAVAIREKALGRNDPGVATSLDALAAVLHEMGAYADARPLHERALAIREKALGKDHPLVATSLANLGVDLTELGVYDEARSLIERALAIQEKALGRDHPEVATCLTNLAGLLISHGAHAEARPLVERALAIREKALGPDHPLVALSLDNGAAILLAQGAYAEARPLVERALAIRRRALGESHPQVAASLVALARVHRALGAYAEARPLYERALALYEQALGKDHFLIAACLNNLAQLLKDQGAYAEARPLYERAVATWERALGEDYPGVATPLNGLALVLVEQKAFGEARPLFDRLLALTERQVRTQASILSGSQRLALVRSVRSRLDSFVWCAPLLGLSGYPEVLRLRGLASRVQTAERAVLRHASGEERKILDALEAAQRQASRLANEIPPARAVEARAAWQRRYAETAAEGERLSLELTKRSASRRAAIERLDLGLEDVQRELGPDTALVDLLRAGALYVAWVVRATGEPVRLNVGRAKDVDGACAEFRESLTEGDPVAAGEKLRTVLWAPIEAHLGAGVKRLVICPDLALAAVPWGALPGKEPGRHLLDEFRISYVNQAQDLVPWKDAPPSGRGALVVGGVDYEGADSAATAASPRTTRPLPVLDRAPRGRRFDALPDTQGEAESLYARLGAEGGALLLGAGATEARFREGVPGKRFVHVATHGFAREDLLQGLYERWVQDDWLTPEAEQRLSAGHDPMLLSGLALAGANARSGGADDDGILTALEASYLDLEGVDLVTLSACQTARGTPESGEGVQGLVQAFQMAGARTVVASLWDVDDEATRLLMESFYERLLRTEDPLSPADALREAALALRDRKDADGTKRYAAPRSWAAFVCYAR